MHSGKVQRLMPESQRSGTIARIRHRDVVVLLHLVGQRHASGNIQLRGNRRRRRNHIQRLIAKVRRRRPSLVRRISARKQVAKHLIQRRALDEARNEITMRRPNRILNAQIDRRSHRSRFLAHRRIVVASKLALLEQHSRSLFKRPAFEHRRVQLTKLLIADQAGTIRCSVCGCGRRFNELFYLGCHKFLNLVSI